MILNNKKYSISLVCCCVAIVAALGLFLPKTHQDPKTAPSLIQGLQAQDSVSYKIFTTDQTNPVIGEITPSKEGTIILPTLNHKRGTNMAYDLEIKTGRGKETANILIQYDHIKNKYKLSASGLGNFQDVAYGLNNKKLKSKTDWAGIFKETDLKPNAKDTHNQINFAFSTINIHDGIEISPSIIKIQLDTTGGGVGNTTPIDSRINKYTPSGDPFLSVIAHKTELDISTKELVENMVHPMMKMTEQFSAVLFQHIATIGAMMDADIQIDTQREFQKLQAEAMRDYHPSEQMCVVGTFVRSLNNAETRADFNKSAYSQIMMDRYTLQKNSGAARGDNNKPKILSPEIRARLKAYQERYCDMSDNNNGLSTLCDKAIPDQERTNKDINYALTILKPLTLDVDFTLDEKTKDEEDIIELGKNLYWFHPFNPISGKKVKNKAKDFMNSRRLMAMHNVASTTLSSIIGQKSEAFKSGEGKNSGVFMKELVKMLLPKPSTTTPAGSGTPPPKPPTPTEILGENPSYYAMMEVLTKKMYQDGNFYTNLYDKPANVERINVSLSAIQLMHNRDRYESMLRREMLSSLLLETALIKEQRPFNAQIERLSIE